MSVVVWDIGMGVVVLLAIAALAEWLGLMSCILAGIYYTVSPSRSSQRRAEWKKRRFRFLAAFWLTLAGLALVSIAVSLARHYGVA